MNRDSLLNEDWQATVDRLGGAERLAASARASKAFVRAREIKTATDLLRLVLAYCLGERGLRLTAAWAAAVGLVDVSNPALLYRLRQCGDWLLLLIGEVLAASAPKPGNGRLIRLLDATVVLQAGQKAKTTNRVWRIHSAFDLPAERFGAFVLTDQTGGEQLDRIPVQRGEIRIGDRVYLQPPAMARVLADGGDFVIRAGWRNACWLDADGNPLDLHSEFRQAAERIDRPIWIRNGRERPLAVRLIAARKSPEAAAAARRKARQQAGKAGYTASQKTLDMAEWFILVTSLPADSFATEEVLALYRLRWRIELAFKRLKSLIGLRAPPGTDARSARTWVLAHLLMALLLEPLVDAFGDSPHWAQAA
jgi:hypothetical protein